MSTPPSRHEVIRIAGPDGRTLCFMVYLGSRKAGWRRFDADAVPPFEGKTAWFEVERDRGQWRFLRKVER